MTHVERLAQALMQRGWMLATAESCTGGMIAARCTDLAGSSQWFERGFITYSNEAKTELLGVRPDFIAAHGAVSVEVAAAMAQGALLHAHADLAVSITGIAGPGGGSLHKPVGTVCFGIAFRDEIHTEHKLFPDTGRDDIRRAALEESLALLARYCVRLG